MGGDCHCVFVYFSGPKCELHHWDEDTYERALSTSMSPTLCIFISESDSNKTQIIYLYELALSQITLNKYFMNLLYWALCCFFFVTKVKNLLVPSKTGGGAASCLNEFVVVVVSKHGFCGKLESKWQECITRKRTLSSPKNVWSVRGEE